MGRRRKRRDPIDDTMELVGAVAALIFGFAIVGTFLVPGLGKAAVAIFQGVTFLVIAVLVCGGFAVLLFVVIRKVLRSGSEPSGSNSPFAKPHGETTLVPPAYLNPFEKISRSEWGLDKPKVVQKQNLHERLRAIDWFQFEKVVSAIYEVRGYKVKRLGGANPDGGIDLIVENGDEQVAIQCKHWKTWTVKLHQVRELLGTLTDAKIKQGVMVTLCGCTQEAREFANKHGIVVVEEDELVKLMQMVDGSVHPRIGAMLNDKRKFCPKCESEMFLKTPGRWQTWKPFWGCSRYPRCRGKISAVD